MSRQPLAFMRSAPDDNVARFYLSIQRDQPIRERSRAEREAMHPLIGTDAAPVFDPFDETLPAFVRRQAE